MDSHWIVLIALLILVIIPWIARQRRVAAVKQVLNRKKKNKENSEMKELAKRFIGKECLIYTITTTDGSVQGVVREVGDSGLILERKSGESELVNLDFVTRIREYPRKKNGKKKDIVLD